MVKKYGYARVSTTEQNLDRQLLELRKHVEDERDIITDKQSGKNFDRPGYRSLRDTLLRRGDTLVIKSIDRLGRNKSQIKDELEHYRQAGVRVQIIDIPTTMVEWPEGQEWVGDMVNDVLIQVYASIAEQEYRTIHQRQAEGIAAAKAAGRHLGRARVERPEGWEQIVALWRGGQLTAVQAMDRLGLKKSTFYKLVREEEQGAP